MTSAVPEPGTPGSPFDMAVPSPLRAAGTGETRSRTQSISSDRPSTVSHGLMSPPISVSPEAAFIAASAASQIVTNDHDSHADAWYDQHGFEISGETALVTPAALHLVNNFLDHLLFNFLSLSGSTSLSTLRPAVSDVLKPKLAKDAINNADEELREYLGGGDDDELLQSQPSPAPGDWDLELVWKRTRLRCMVYSSLGDMEEEDEDHHMEEGCLSDDDDKLGGTVSPAVAIFLTSILEFLGEQALIVAGQAAWHRMRVKHEKDLKDGSRSRADLAGRVVIEEVDMERTALDRTLGRLWRAWKKRIRTPGIGGLDSPQRSFPRDFRAFQQRSSSVAEGAVPTSVEEHASEPELASPADDIPGNRASVAELDDDSRAAAVPLPISDRDVDEIEVPGLVHYSDEEDDDNGEQEEDSCVKRPKSLIVLPLTVKATPPTPAMSQPHTTTFHTRKRSNSLPTPSASPYASPKRRAKIEVSVAEIAATVQPSDEPIPEEISRRQVDTEKKSSQSTESVSNSEAEHDQTSVPPAHGETQTNEPAIVGGIAAAAGISRVAKRIADTDNTDADDSDYEEIAEARVMTSARISLGGSRSISPATSDQSNKPPLTISTPSLLVRSGSLRLVDVNSPRTPSFRSRGSSKQESDSSSHTRSADVSRSSSVRTQPLVEDHHPVEDTRALRVSGTSSLGKGRSNVLSISEAEENAELPATRTVESVPEGVRSDAISELKSSTRATGLKETTQAQTQDIQPTLGSSQRHSPPSTYSPQRSPIEQQQIPPRSSVSPPQSGTFFQDDLAEAPTRSPKNSPKHPRPQATQPPVPERSLNRYRHGHSPSAGSPGQPTTIGIVSVDRPAALEDAAEIVRPSPDHSTIRQQHNSGSSISSSYKMRGARASQDSTATRPEDVARNFEELIQSNETIQYTLTPETMRELEGSPSTVRSGSPLVPTKSRKSEDAGRITNRERAGSSSVNKPLDVKRSASITRATGLRSHPIQPLSSHPVQLALDTSTSDKLSGSIPRAPPVSMQNRARGAGPQARDARVPQESLVEFAEFIRATGPSGMDAGPAPIRRNPSLTMRNGSGQASTSSVDYRRPPVSGSSSRARLQARGASISNGDDNSDLIDFIRRGPPSAEGGPRIPRTVAPFRTTMDSDQLTAAVGGGGKAIDAVIPDNLHDTRYSQASTNSASIQSSVNSSSALLGRKPVPPSQNGSQFDEQDMMPVRKTRLVKDPYAIDFSDEEDDDFDTQLPTQRKPAPKEESLIDFLNSAPPPPSQQMAPVPFDINRTHSMPAEPILAPKKKASAPSLMSRFRTNSTANMNSSAKNPKSPTNAGRSMWDSRSSNSRGGGASTHAPSSSRGYVPIQVHIPTGGDLYPIYDPATPPIPSIPANMNSARSRVPMKKFEPRDAVSVPSRGTSELADFLRSSEPPSSISPAPFIAQPESNGGSKFFGRRKKSSGYA